MGANRLTILIATLVLVSASGCGGAGEAAQRTIAKPATSPSEPAHHRSVRAPSAPPLAVTVRVSPQRSGTPAQPQPIAVRLTIRVGRRPATDPPPIAAIDVALPAGTLYRGAGFPTCSADTLGRNGPAACPRGSIMGSGSAIALADTALTQARLTVLNGGEGKVLFFTAMDAPARVRSATVGTLAKRPGGGYSMHLVIPHELQSVAGVPLYLRKLAVAGHGGWLASTGCRDRWRVRATAHFEDGSERSRSADVPCR